MCAEPVNSWRLCVFALLLLIFGTAPAQDRASLTLSADAPLLLALAKDDRRDIMLTLDPGQWLLEADEDFVDVVIEVSDEAGHQITTLNGVDAGFAEIRYLIDISNEKVYRLAVTAKSAEAKDATLTLNIQRAEALLSNVHAATATKLESALSELPLQASDEELIAARDVALAAAEQWRQAGQTRRAGVNQYYAATLSYLLEDILQSLEHAVTASQTLTPTGETKWLGFSIMLAGLNQSELRNLDIAQSLLQRSETILDPMYFGRRVNPSKSNQCYVYLKQRDPDNAEQCYRDILPIAEQADDQRSVARYYRNIAGAYEIRGDFSGAVEVLESALGEFDDGEQLRELTSVLNNLALSLNRLGKTQRSIAYFQRALEVSRQIGDDKQTARVLGNLASVYSQLGIPRRSVSLLKEAVRLNTNGHPEALTIKLRNLAYALSAVGDFDEARKRLGDARRSAGQTRDVTSLNAIEVLHANIEINTGDVDAAIRRLRPVIAELRGDDGQRSQYASALMQQGRALQAKEQWRASLEAIKQANLIYVAQSDRLKQAESLAVMAWLLWEQDEQREAQSHAQQAIELVESLRADIANADLRASYQSAVADASELLIHSYIVLDRSPERALAIAETFRARTLVDALSKSSDAPTQRVPPSLLRERDELRARINQAEGRRIRGQQGADFSELAVRLDALDGQIAALDPRYRAAKSSVSLQPDAMRRLLSSDQIALQYFLGKRRSYRWLITPERISAIELPQASEIDSQARELNIALAKRGKTNPIAAQLGNLVLGGVESVASKATDVIVIADRGLHYVPFDVLGTGGTGKPILDGKNVTYAPSLTTLALNRDNPRNPGNVITVLADPIFNDSDHRAQNRTSAQQLRSADSVRGLNRLAMTALEADTIESLATTYDVNVYEGFAANVDTLKTTAVSDAEVLHIATHGFVDDEIPESNGLALSIRNAAGEPRSGYVGLRDIYELRLNAKLVVLSACDTALGRDMAGEGLLGMTRGFMYAGAERVLASLWQVEDRATAELMKHFYTALLNEGRSPPAALAHAKAQLQKSRRWRHPYYWSGFVLLGDWAPMR